MRRSLLAFALALALVGGILPVRAGNLDRTTEGQNVTVSLSSPFSSLPPSGCVPFHVNIRNDRNEAGTWQLSFHGTSSGFSGVGGTITQQDFSVGPNTSGSFNVLACLPIVSEDKGNTMLNISLTGPGFSNSSKAYFAYFYTNNSGSRLPYTVIGNDVLGNIGLGPLTSYCKDMNQEFYGSDINPSDLPADWKAYSGVNAIILKDNTWLNLSAAQREALSGYVAQGGRLVLLTPDDPAQKASELQLPGPEGKPGDYGFGSIALMASSTFPPAPSTLYTLAADHEVKSAFHVDQTFSTWPLRKLVGAIAVSGAFILTFVILFGGLVGPVNLFVFARGPKRFRLFWTTPLISIVACLALIAGILLTDGLGGTGKQMIAFYSLPGSNREAVIQEQVARTAVLFSSQWRNDQNYLITPISTHALNDALGIDDSPAGYRYRRRQDIDDSPDVYRKDGNLYSGNWFRSRAVSGQYLQAMRPSRSSLTVLNPQGLETRDEAPIVLSSFPQELTRVFLVDAQRRYWTCAQLEPGHKKTCIAAKPHAFYAFWDDACANAGGKLRPLLTDAKTTHPGLFYATGLPASSESLTTLGEVRWDVVSGVYLGPWVASPTEETTP